MMVMQLAEWLSMLAHNMTSMPVPCPYDQHAETAAAHARYARTVLRQRAQHIDDLATCIEMGHKSIVRELRLRAQVMRSHAQALDSMEQRVPPPPPPR